MNHTRLSSTVTVEQYLRIEAEDDRQAAAEFVRTRFEERYLAPALDSATRHGFAMMALACLTIEALQSFRKGLGSTRNQSRALFRTFFAEHETFILFSEGNWFYDDIRCGLLHQAEARSGWRIVRRGVLIDLESRTINADKFLRALRSAVHDYARSIAFDDKLWSNFKTKMACVVKNCDD